MDGEENERENPNKPVQHSMSQALQLLHEELTAEVEHYSMLQQEHRWRNIFQLFSHTSVHSTYHWTTCLFACVLSVLLFVSYGFSSDSEGSAKGWLVVEAILLLISVIANVYINILAGTQENQEFIRLIRTVIEKLSRCMKFNTWNSSHFPQLYSPLSPCLSTQWTIRDQQVLNLPIPLLVKGDIILLRPGLVVPGKCSEVQETLDSAPSTVLNEGDVYAPIISGSEESFQTPQARDALKVKKFVLKETPYLTNLRKILKDTKRPASVIEHELFFVGIQWIERKVVPFVILVMMISNALRYMYMNGHVGEWTEMFITLQVHSVLPLVPVFFPSMWLVINFYGQARVFSAFETAKGSKPLSDDSFDTDSSISVDEARVDLSWERVFDWFKKIISGKAEVVTRKIKITHILGSVTSLCCVDKKGILSYPNPSPEKIFFLKSGSKDLLSSTQVGTSVCETNGKKTRERNKSDKDLKAKYHGSDIQTCTEEVLDLTHNPKKSFGVHFDDPSWKKYITSLKPLGLNILANTCNLETAEWYTRFTDHVACAALENEETVAVVNRRCLCPLAREIGFSDQAVDVFKLEKVLGQYRHVSAEATARERLQRAKSFIRHKIPMPNMVSVIMREKVSGSCQLLSQGTVDILLSCCSDFWNGRDLSPLTENDRKRILGFYQRTSIGSYCTAFSYRPFSGNTAVCFSNQYIELPKSGNTLHEHQHMGETFVDNHLDMTDVNRMLSEGLRSFSMDSLQDRSSTLTSEESESYFQAQCNQIFIGMVTMQYQARQDFVQLIDKLESACIRFVHFSQENEVRSRVFSEKMGLEAGWNCHISLLSEKQYISGTTANICSPEMFSPENISHRTSRYSSRRSTSSSTRGDNSTEKSKTQKQKALEVRNLRSNSAPSIVNLDPVQVKFEMNVQTEIVTMNDSYHNDSAYNGVDEFSPLTGEDTLMYEREESYWDSDDGESRHTSSYFTENTEDSLSGALHNRAKLPQGIENIRPHLSSVDNVPLLVNLFTDCTPETSREMIKIMQEHGEVVVVVGSSVNMQNVSLFLQADCSLSLEPLYPQVCLKQSAMTNPWNSNHPSPIELTSAMLSVMCPLLFSREDNISLIHLIAEARTHLMATRNCFYFILCCSLSVTLIQVLASFFQFPPVLASHQLLWLVLVVIPLLGITMIGNPVDARVMSLATGKNRNHITVEMITRFFVYYLLRFLPPVLITLFCYAFTLDSYCQSHLHSNNGTNCAIFDFEHTPANTDRIWYEKFSGGLVIAQNILLFLLVFYFECISMSFVHWTDPIWQQLPSTNKLWLCLIPLLFVWQLIFFICDVVIRSEDVTHVLDLSDIHPAVWAVGLSFSIVIVLLNEIVKHQEIKLAVRYQKRARLDFGTKLGLNSPF